MVIRQQHQVADENMSKLTSASKEAANLSSIQQQCFYANSIIPANSVLMKKKRNLRGNPEPEADVVALSPKTLMATNRFVCEVCNRGFQRDQNLQLHRRGHNLPWKLKQRTNKEAQRKKVYVCPEATCVHHNPSRALGDLTGIKKHFSRKHGEKKWKCERCSKKYAVQSDLKAHSKICGTREYRCHCGTLFSRRDSFITHRAFCDALAEENARAITAIPLVNHHHQLPFPQPMTLQDQALPFQQASMMHDQFPHSLTRKVEATSGGHGLPQEFLLKREQQQLQKRFDGMGPDVPQWLPCQGSASLNHLELPSSFYSSRKLEQECSGVENVADQSNLTLPLPYQVQASSSLSSSPHMSATALLQKAAQMGATSGKQLNMSHAEVHTTNAASVVATSNAGFGLELSAVNHEIMSSGGFAPPSILQDVALNSFSSAPGLDGPFEDAFRGVMRSKREGVNGMDAFIRRHGRTQEGGGGGSVGRDEMTRDFLGLRAFSQQGGILGWNLS